MARERAAAGPCIAKGTELTSDAGKSGCGKGSSLEEYAEELETQLALKAALLDEVVGLHRSLEARVTSLEEGISWKDAQLEALSRQSTEAWNRANQELLAACRDRDAWRERAGQLEEENCALRDEILERIEMSERQRIAEVQQQQAQSQMQSEMRNLCDLEDPQPRICHLTQELSQSQQKIVLLEEELRVRSGLDPNGRSVTELDDLPELSAVPYASAWAAVGMGAADRICGSSPHLQSINGGPGKHFICGFAGGVNVATGGMLPVVDEHSTWDDDMDSEGDIEVQGDLTSPPPVLDDFKADAGSPTVAPETVAPGAPTVEVATTTVATTSSNAHSIASGQERVSAHDVLPCGDRGHEAVFPVRTLPTVPKELAIPLAGHRRHHSGVELSVHPIATANSAPSTWNHPPGEAQMLMAQGAARHWGSNNEVGLHTPRPSASLSPNAHQRRPSVQPLDPRVRMEEARGYASPLVPGGAPPPPQQQQRVPPPTLQPGPSATTWLPAQHSAPPPSSLLSRSTASAGASSAHVFRNGLPTSTSAAPAPGPAAAPPTAALQAPLPASGANLPPTALPSPTQQVARPWRGASM